MKMFTKTVEMIPHSGTPATETLDLNNQSMIDGWKSLFEETGFAVTNDKTWPNTGTNRRSGARSIDVSYDGTAFSFITGIWADSTSAYSCYIGFSSTHLTALNPDSSILPGNSFGLYRNFVKNTLPTTTEVATLTILVPDNIIDGIVVHTDYGWGVTVLPLTPANSALMFAGYTLDSKREMWSYMTSSAAVIRLEDMSSFSSTSPSYNIVIPTNGKSLVQPLLSEDALMSGQIYISRGVQSTDGTRFFPALAIVTTGILNSLLAYQLSDEVLWGAARDKGLFII